MAFFSAADFGLRPRAISHLRRSKDSIFFKKSFRQFRSEKRIPNHAGLGGKGFKLLPTPPLQILASPIAVDHLILAVGLLAWSLCKIPELFDNSLCASPKIQQNFVAIGGDAKRSAA